MKKMVIFSEKNVSLRKTCVITATTKKLVTFLGKNASLNCPPLLWKKNPAGAHAHNAG